MEPEGSLPHSQASATCPCPGPAQSSPHTHIPPPALLFQYVIIINNTTIYIQCNSYQQLKILYVLLIPVVNENNAIKYDANVKLDKNLIQKIIT